ncbi:MAG TPA: hypothetical protein VK183_09370, partial [Flavobacterium sp.]|nr:hypothetical protein [Flavobacterium sp.]
TAADSFLRSLPPAGATSLRPSALPRPSLTPRRVRWFKSASCPAAGTDVPYHLNRTAVKIPTFKLPL